MTTQPKKLLACPVCHERDFLRATVREDAAVTVNEDGKILEEPDYPHPLLETSYELYCSNCGSYLLVQQAGDVHRLVTLSFQHENPNP